MGPQEIRNDEIANIVGACSADSINHRGGIITIPTSRANYFVQL